MSTIVEFTVPADDFSLGRVLRGGAFERIELDRAVPTANAIVPFFWVYGGDPDALCAHLVDDDRVADAGVLDRVDGAALMCVEWRSRPDGLLENVAAQNARLLAASGTPDRWRFSLRFHAAADVTAFQQACNEKGIALDVTTVHELRKSDAGVDIDSVSATLTAPQREVLVAAVEGGYFAVPRRTTLVEIAADMEISDQAVSERLRRALSKLSAPVVSSDLDE